MVMNFLSLFKKTGFPAGLLFFTLIVGMFSSVSFEASAQSTRELINRIGRLENEIDTLNRAIYKGKTQPPPSGFSDRRVSGGGSDSAALEVRLQQLEGEIQRLTGRVEETAHRTRKLEQHLERVSSDLTLRVNDLEQEANGNQAAASSSGGLPLPAGASVAPSAPQNSGANGFQWNSNGTSNAGAFQTTGTESAEVLYERSFSLVRSKKYSEAQGGFEAFLQRHPKHVLAGNAKYWLGETHYVRNDFKTAARLFAEAYQEYPKNSKAADNLLKLGLSFVGLEKKEEACVTFSQIETEFAEKSSVVLARAKKEKERIGCS